MIPLIPIIAALVVVGFALYLISIIPLDPVVRQVIRALVIFVLVLWVLSLFVPMNGLFTLRR